MADEVDVANESQEKMLAASVSHRKPVNKLEPQGYCHNPKCELEFDEGSVKLFCNGKCATEAERYLK